MTPTSSAATAVLDDAPIVTSLAVTPEEREEVFRFRYSIYCEQQGRLTDVADHQRRTIEDEDDERSSILVARQEGRIVGTLRATWGTEGFSPELVAECGIAAFLEAGDPAKTVVLGRFLIDPALRGGLASSLLILELAQLCIERRIEVLLCDSEPHLLGYYRSLGFRPHGRLYTQGTGLVVPLVFFAGDLAHLEAIGSPVLALIPDDYCPPPSPALMALLRDTAARHVNDASEELERWWDAATTEHFAAPDLFDGLDADQRALLLDNSFVLDFEPGDLVIAEGLTTRTLYAILDGTFEIVVAGQLVDVVSKGAVVGEFAMLMDCHRTATVRAATTGRALTISDRRVDELVEQDPALAARLLRNLCRVVVHKLATVTRG